MIIPNGTIEFKEKAPGGIDPATGYPSKPKTASWSEPIPCQYIPNTRNNLGKVEGERFTTASYTLLLEDQSLPGSEQLRLTDASGKYLGEFSLISPPEPLAAVCEIKLLV